MNVYDKPVSVQYACTIISFKGTGCLPQLLVKIMSSTNAHLKNKNQISTMLSVFSYRYTCFCMFNELEPSSYLNLHNIGLKI